MARMNAFQHAAQIWSVLVWAACSRQTLTYDILGRLIGIPQFGLGQHLAPIQSFCLLHDLPPLTSLVVTEAGSPGLGFTAAEQIPKAQAEVFKFDWLEKVKAPTPDELKDAAAKRPSNGIAPMV